MRRESIWVPGRVGEVLDTSSFMFPLCPRLLSASSSSFAVRYYKLPSLFFTTTTTTDTTFRKSPYQSLPKQNKSKQANNQFSSISTTHKSPNTFFFHTKHTGNHPSQSIILFHLHQKTNILPSQNAIPPPHNPPPRDPRHRRPPPHP